jgi:hypothetical protein
MNVGEAMRGAKGAGKMQMTHISGMMSGPPMQVVKTFFFNFTHENDDFADTSCGLISVIHTCAHILKSRFMFSYSHKIRPMV